MYCLEGWGFLKEKFYWKLWNLFKKVEDNYDWIFYECFNLILCDWIKKYVLVFEVKY